MSADQQKPDVGRILAGLKDFQRETADFVFRRLYQDTKPADRFLIADEVGLGKTMVARGLIARAIDRLWPDVERIDILYICSNGEIARQNIGKLNVTGADETAFATRMTLLPVQLRKLKGRRVNFLSFTPGTSFNLRSSTGIVNERVMLYHMLRRFWGFGDKEGPKALLRNDVSPQNWEWYVNHFRDEIDPTLAERYLAALAGTDLKDRFESLARSFSHLKRTPGWELRREQVELIGDLRRLLARACAHALEPDIVILDEFQRFKDLLDADNDMANLARHLFNYPGAKSLLLSATPYKMYTLHGEVGDEDHYRDFIRTVQFLMPDPQEVEAFQQDLTRYRTEICRVGSRGPEALREAKTAVESRLRQVMVRTERLSVSLTPDGMLAESRSDLGGLAPADLRAFAVVDRIARNLNAGDAVEYWKSAPYLLNIMDREGYLLKRAFVKQVEGPGAAELASILNDTQEHLLSWRAIKKYRQVDPGNAKLRTLLRRTVERGAWRLLWVPASWPYYAVSEGPYADRDLDGFTKALVFSSWQMVPKAIAMLVSYEAERLAARAYSDDAAYDDRISPPLRFPQHDGRRFPGMNALVPIYPCWTLATRIDPAATGLPGKPPTLDQVKGAVGDQVRRLLAPVLEEHGGDRQGPADERWYWAALALLDQRYARSEVEPWLDETGELSWESAAPRGEADQGESHFDEHVNHFWECFCGDVELGRAPDDLTEVLTSVALASPGVAALRALLRVTGGSGADSPQLLTAAARVAMGFRTLFSLPDAIMIVRGLRGRHEESRYWESLLDYCTDGNLQAVVDEYAHMLNEAVHAGDGAPGPTALRLAEEMQAALSVRSVNLSFDEIRIRPDGTGLSLKDRRLRCRLALRFGDGRDEENPGGEPTRADSVRRAFNSPFRPFVLASTSVGQEGLDFHPYCHEIYHWNLPSNPVDLEQREGRIHRYKGHVIRRNVAHAFPPGTVDVQPLEDPWAKLFWAAREASAGFNELVPYWVFECEGGAKVVRHVPALPLSREVGNLESLHRTLGAYRMVFGQPRQEDLVTYLRGQLEQGLELSDLLRYRIELAPGERSEKVGD